MSKKPDIRPARMMPSDPAATPAQVAGPIDLAFRILARHYLAILLVALVSGLAAWGAVISLPRYYSSFVYLRIDEQKARSADALMSSIPLLDSVLTKVNVSGDTIEERRRRLDKRRSLSVAPNEVARSAGLFRQEVVDTSPERAQELNRAFIDAWLEMTKPFPARKAFVEAEIVRNEQQIALINKYLEQTDKAAASEPTAAALPVDSRTPTIIAVPAETRKSGVAELLTKREEAIEALAKLRQEMRGISRDVILSDPSVTDESSWPRARLLIPLTIVGAEMLLLIMLVLWETVRPPR